MGRAVRYLLDYRAIFEKYIPIASGGAAICSGILSSERDLQTFTQSLYIALLL
jgi:hypothetical protein